MKRLYYIASSSTLLVLGEGTEAPAGDITSPKSLVSFMTETS